VTKPLETARALCPWYLDSPQEDAVISAQEAVRLAPPGPCYDGLTNNFSLICMELKDHPWRWEIPMATPERPDHPSEWTTHRVILDHIQDAASRFGLEDRVHYGTLVERVQKRGDKWAVTT
jgi:cation diffusion facilitator CzcD-associated flavoprotein CzcO